MNCCYCNGELRKFGTYGKNKIQRYQCVECHRTSTGEKRADGMRISEDSFTRVIELLTEGVGINAATRLTGTHKKTVLRSLKLAGERCEKLMDSRMRNLDLDDIQCDEIWTFVAKKERHVRPNDDHMLVGDQYTYTALDRETKLVICYRIGKRNAPMTREFINDLAERLEGRTQISTDAFGAYQWAIRDGFHGHADHGQIIKIYAGAPNPGRSRYSPPPCIGSIRQTISGEPNEARICTSHVERSNLSMRTFLRRMTRLCLGFSKKLQNLKYAVAVYFGWYNFVRIHGSLKTTPAVAAGITERPWSLAELLTVTV